MLTPDILRKLRGCGTVTQSSGTTEPSGAVASTAQSAISASSSQSPSSSLSQTANPSALDAGQRREGANESASEGDAPIEVPCKYYDDEEGHFAYIDGKTHLPIHFNIKSGRKYTQDDINYMSFEYASRNLPSEQKKVRWDQVINPNTLFDRFGSPVFTEEEIRNASLAHKDEDKDKDEDIPYTDKFGYPI